MASVGPEDNMGVGGVRRIEVTERERPVFGGTEFGAVGPYPAARHGNHDDPSRSPGVFVQGNGLM
jgi:hypothetical protein